MKDKLVKWIKDWFDENAPESTACVAISGGKDSSVVAALCVEALGKDRVIGIKLPDGIQADISDSDKLINHLGIHSLTINIEEAKNSFLYSLDTTPSSQAKQNLPPRLRMACVYLVAQSYNGIVMNTCNLSETLLGWETKWGDAVGDISPLGDLTVSEVKQIGHELGLPNELVEKTPADGLCGSSDEDALGITYADVDKFIRTGEATEEVHNRIMELYTKSKHKRSALSLPTFKSGLMRII